MFKEGVVVIDVGITREPSDLNKSGFKLYGDVDFNSVAPKPKWVTPIPGGVGPMTIKGLLKNTMTALQNKYSDRWNLCSPQSIQNNPGYFQVRIG